MINRRQIYGMLWELHEPSLGAPTWSKLTPGLRAKLWFGPNQVSPLEDFLIKELGYFYE